MGSHLLKLTPLHFKLLFLCLVFLNAISVSLTFSVSNRVDSYDTGLHADTDADADADEPLGDQFTEDDDLDQHPDFDDKELDTIKKTMIEGLGFKKIPDVTKVSNTTVLIYI